MYHSFQLLNSHPLGHIKIKNKNNHPLYNMTKSIYILSSIILNKSYKFIFFFNNDFMDK